LAPSDALVMGYVTTSLHWIFALAQLSAVIATINDPAGKLGPTGHVVTRA
jgi:hypothetical protein